MLTCSICVIAYNEEKSIGTLLEDIKRQDYDHGLCEVILVDGGSTDGTRAIMQEFWAENEVRKDRAAQSLDVAFKRVLVLDNPKRTLPSGWNVALGAYSGDVIIKIDAHAEIPEDFISKNIRVLESGEDICGGVRPAIVDEPTPWKETLLLAENSMFGSSIAPYRNNPGKTYVKSLFHGAYRREVFDKVGNFNEELVRTEDNEIHYRMRKAGFKLRFDPEIVSYQHIRSSLPKMVKQKYLNGYWIGITAKKCPECLEKYHFVPLAFVSAIGLSAVGLFVTNVFGKNNIMQTLRKVVKFLTKLMWGIYGTLAVVMSLAASFGAGNKRNKTNAVLPVLFPILHIAYGVGTLRGILKKESR
jgi:glycosyltransferase involved in cell wall biosynthesis